MSEELNIESSFDDKDTNKVKLPRVRSASYPSYTILFCVELTQKIYQNFGSSLYCTREQLSAALKVSVGQIQTQLSSAASYGLLEIKKNEGYKPTPLFIKIYKPYPDSERQEGLLQCLHNPVLYLNLFNDFEDGFIPPLSALSTILFRRHSIAEAASELAAEIFIENLTDLKVLNEDRHIGLQSASMIAKLQETNNDNQSDTIDDIPYTDIVQPIKETIEPKNIVLPAPNSFVEVLPNEIPPITYIITLKDNREASLTIPKSYTDKDLSKIIRFVKGLKIEDDDE